MEIDLLKSKGIRKEGSLGQVRKIVAYEAIKELHEEKDTQFFRCAKS
ncbi:hypothetical protein [Enterococcus avium]|nr:hypothetical protein [Enterococcus avium]